MALLVITGLNELLSSLVIMLLTLLLLGILMKKFNQPYFVAYITAGIILGPHALKVFTNDDTIATIGELGLIIQMFFIGTKLEIQSFAILLLIILIVVDILIINSAINAFIFRILKVNWRNSI